MYPGRVLITPRHKPLSHFSLPSSSRTHALQGFVEVCNAPVPRKTNCAAVGQILPEYSARDYSGLVMACKSETRHVVVFHLPVSPCRDSMQSEGPNLGSLVAVTVVERRQRCNVSKYRVVQAVEPR